MKEIEEIKRFIKVRIGNYEKKVERVQDSLLSESMEPKVRKKLEEKRNVLYYRDDEALEILRYIVRLEGRMKKHVKDKDRNM